MANEIDKQESLRHPLPLVPTENSLAESTPISTGSCPISALPEEILTYILDILHDITKEGDALQPLLRIRVPTIASHVSSHWRFIALQNPLWWAYIHITPPWKFEAIETYLERSKQCSLDVRISVHQNYHALREEGLDLPSLKGYSQLGPIVFPHLSRCRSLILQGYFRQDIQLLPFLLETLMSREMPYLEEFTLDGDFQIEGQAQAPARKSLFSSAPRLTKVCLGGLAVLTYSPPFSAITSLHLSRATDNHHLPFSTLGGILSSCRCLSMLAVYDDLIHNWPGIETTCSVPLLESLYILGNMLSVSELLLYLSAPKLREVLIAPVIDGDFTALITNTTTKDGKPRFSSVTTLTLAPAYADAFNDALPHASACFPNVQTLIFANFYLPEFFDSFTEDSLVLFPQLLDLALTDVHPGMVASIARVVHFRETHGVPLRNFFIDSDSMVRFKDSADSWGDVNVKVADLWENRRRKALYSNVKDLFIGRSVDD